MSNRKPAERAPATAALWGVGRYEGPDGPKTWPIGHDEIQRDLGSARRRLAEVGVGAGDRVLFCSMLSEAGQFWPWILAAMLGGAQLSCADATEGEAQRVATFCGLLDYAAVIGVSASLLDGLEGLGRDPGEVFAGVRLVAARPDAQERLVGARAMALVGPAFAIAPEPAAPPTVDPDEWSLDVDREDRVLVSALKPRVTPFARTPTAIRGRIVA
jgi:hypothetical protein